MKRIYTLYIYSIFDVIDGYLFMNLKNYLKNLNIPWTIEKICFSEIMYDIISLLILLWGQSIYETFIAIVVTLLYIVVLIVEKINKNISIYKLIKKVFIILIVITAFIVRTRCCGIFSDENIKKMKADNFNKTMSYALYNYSIKKYSKSIPEFKKAISFSNDDDEFECKCWLLENYSRNNNIDLKDKLQLELYDYSTLKINDNIDIVNQVLPLSELISLYNNEEWSEMINVAAGYEYMNDRCIALFKILSLIMLDNDNISNEKIYNAILYFNECDRRIKNSQNIENILLKDIAYVLSDTGSPYSIIFYAELLNNGKSAFFNQCLYVLPDYNDITNVRWFSVERYQYIQNICIESYKNINSEIKRIYYLKFNTLFMFMGLVDYFENNEKIIDQLYKTLKINESLYNFIRLEDNKYFFIKLSYNDFGGIKMYTQAELVIVKFDNNQLYYDDIGFLNNKYSLLLNKLFVADIIDNYLLLEMIEGTSEYLSLNLIDFLNKKTISLISEHYENYHVSNLYFDLNDTITYTSEKNNSWFGNSEKKVQYDVTIKIDWNNLSLDYIINYPDPALQLFFCNKELDFVTPIKHRLKENADSNIIKNISGHDEIVLYSKIQESYEYFMKNENFKYSGLHILYNIADEQFHYFLFVKKVGKTINIIDFFEVKDNKLISLLRK